MEQESERQHKGAQLDVSNVPFEVLATILSYVPLKERLSTCALVCQTWAAAGAGASKVLAVQLRSQAQADNLTAWLAQRGSVIEQLSVATDHQAFEESLLQWKQQQCKQKANGDGHVVVNQPPVNFWASLAGHKEEGEPTPQCFYAELPLQQLHGLRRLSLENVKVGRSSCRARSSSNSEAGKATPAGADHPTTCSDDKPSSSGGSAGTDRSAECVSRRGGSDDPDRRGGGRGSLAHLTHLHTDSSFLSLVRALEGGLQLLGSLEVLRITLGPRDSEFVGSYLARAGDAALQALCLQCTRLRKLLLGTAYVTPEGLKQVSCLRQLQHVELHIPGGSARRPVSLAPWLGHLPAQHLTQLVLKPLACRDPGRALDLGPSSITQLTRFTCLRHLDIAYGSSFAPAVLAPLTCLTHLQLSDIGLNKDLSAPTSISAAGGQLAAAGGAAAMLAVLPCLQELRVLQLSPGLLPAPHAPPEQYAALTFSRHLTFLSLYHCQLPAGAAGAMFPASRCLPGLKAIRMPQPPAGQRPSSAQVLNTPSPFLSSGAAAALRAVRETAAAAGSSGASSSGRPGAPFGPGSLEGLAACCPNVAQLWLTAAVAVDTDLSPLLNLSGLTELQLGGAVVDDALAEGVLCGLSQLQRLDLVQCPRLTDAGLVHLTALTALTSLQVRDCGLSHCTAGLGQVLYMCKRQEGFLSGTPVCERLRQQCINSRDCLLVMLQQRDKQLAAAATALAAAEARAVAAEARAAAADARDGSAAVQEV